MLINEEWFFLSDAAKRQSWRFPCILDQQLTTFTVDIAVADMQNILSRLTTKPYITSEVVYEGGGGVTSDEYTGIGKDSSLRTKFIHLFTSSSFTSSGEVQE